MDREEKKLNMFLGKTTSWEYVFVDYAFRYKDWMSWLTHSIFEFLTQDELDERIDDYDWIYIWKDAVANDVTTESFDDWFDYVKYSWDAKSIVRDDSYWYHSWLTSQMKLASERDWKEYEYSDCIWWWRLWKDSKYSDRNNYEYIDEENFNEFEKLLAEYEK